MSIRKIIGVLAIIVVVVDAQRPIATFLTNVGDFLGYDVFRRPRIVLALPASIPVGPAAGPIPAPGAPPAPGAAPAPGGPAPAAPAGAPAPPMAAAAAPPPAPNVPVAPGLTAAPANAGTQLLTDSVRRQFSINLNWDRNRSPPSPEPVIVANLVNPPVALSSAPAGAPAAPAAAPAPNPAAVPVPVPVAAPPEEQPAQAPVTRNVDYDEEVDSADYEDRPKRFHIELPDEIIEAKREIHGNDQNDAKEKFKKDFNQFWDSSPWTVEHGYKYILPEGPEHRKLDKEETKEINNYQVFKIPEDHNEVRNLKVTHNIKLYQSPAEEQISAPSTAVTYFATPPKSFKGQNIDYVVQHKSPVAAPSYLTSKVVNAALLRYFDEKSRQARPVSPQAEPSYLTSKLVNNELLRYFDKKFKNDAISKQQVSNANPVDDVPYQQDYVHPVAKSIPALVNPLSTLEYYSIPDESPPLQHEGAAPYKDDIPDYPPMPYKEDRPVEKAPDAKEKLEEEPAEKKPLEYYSNPDDSSSKKQASSTEDNDEQAEDSPSANAEAAEDDEPVEEHPASNGDDSEKVVNRDEAEEDESSEEQPSSDGYNSDKIVLIDEDVRYKPNNRYDDSKEEQENLENAKQVLEESIKETVNVFKANFNKRDSPKGAKIVEINDKENFEVENLKDASETQEQQREEDNGSETKEEPKKEIEDEKSIDESQQKEKQPEESQQKESEEKKAPEQQETVSNSAVENPGNTADDEIKDLDKFIEKHFSDFKIPDYESIRDEVRSKDVIEYYGEESDNNEQQADANAKQNDDEGSSEIEENSEHSEKEDERESSNESVEDNERARNEDDDEEVEEKEESRQDKNYKNQEDEEKEATQDEPQEADSGESQNERQENEAEDEDSGESETERVEDEAEEDESGESQAERTENEEEESGKINTLQKQHEKSFYSIFPKLGEGSSFVNFFENEFDNNGKDSKVNSQVESKPYFDEYYKSFGYPSTSKPQETKQPAKEATASSKEVESSEETKNSAESKKDPVQSFDIHRHYEKEKQSFLNNLADTKEKQLQSKQNVIHDGSSKNNFQNKDSHEATERTVVQPLYSGIWNVDAVQELYTSDKPVTVPFDHEYAASANSETQQKPEAAVRVKRAVPDIEEFLLERPQAVKDFDRILSYTEDFSYEVPEPKLFNYKIPNVDASEKREKYLKKRRDDGIRDHMPAASNLAKFIEDDIEKQSLLFNKKVSDIKGYNSALEYVPETTNHRPNTKSFNYGQKKGASGGTVKYSNNKKVVSSYDSADQPSQISKFISKYANQPYFDYRKTYSSRRFRRSAPDIDEYLQERPLALKSYDGLYKYNEDFTYEVPEPKVSPSTGAEQEEASDNNEEFEVKSKRDDFNEFPHKAGARHVEDEVSQFDNIFRQKVKQIKKDNDALEEYSSASSNQVPKLKDSKYRKKKETYREKKKYGKKNSSAKIKDSAKEASHIDEGYIGGDIEKLTAYLKEKPEVIKDFENHYEYNDDFTYEVPEPKIGEYDETNANEKKENTEGDEAEEYDEEASNKQTKTANDDDNDEVEEYSVDGPAVIKDFENNNEYVADSYNQKFTYEAPEPGTPNYAQLEKKDYTPEVDDRPSPNLQVRSNSSGRRKLKVTLDKPVHRAF